MTGSGFYFCSVDWSVVKVATFDTCLRSFLSFSYCFFTDFCVSFKSSFFVFCGAMYFCCTLLVSRSSLLELVREVINSGSETSDCWGILELGWRFTFGPSFAADSLGLKTPEGVIVAFFGIRFNALVCVFCGAFWAAAEGAIVAVLGRRLNPLLWAFGFCGEPWA